MAARLKPIEEQVIVVTGASSGIGLATALLAAERGAAVVLVARNQDALQQITGEIRAKGGRAAFLAADLADEGAPHRIADLATREFGGFDTWINNAAVAMFARLDDTTMGEHRQIFDIGYFGLVNASLLAARRLRERGGAIINVGSILSDRSVPVQGAYSAMKHAVQGFTEALRMELEMENAPISVTLIKPTGMHTPYPDHARNKMDKPAAIPPTVYDPRLTAEAICHAAEHSKRAMIVGGQGIVLTKLANIFPRSTDKIMERFFGEELQSIDRRPPAGTKDNLFEPRRDGDIESSHDQYVRRRSLTLKAQMHPLATAAIAGGAIMAAAGLILGRRAMSRRSAFEPRQLHDLTDNNITGHDPSMIEILEATPYREPDAADIHVG
ncbi:SDR family oxidoreductase [Allosphingosinicella vermicomposti]|uniref:SDR family oxidoreductase n=1 Tax=Allosphingosinicella vermicomposti TaxID=614671 RepID=UPI000D0FC75A|nr:SDR family oxidoreductase [Allosphingosinicella vermicomposti]